MEFAKPLLQQLVQIELARMMRQKLLQLMLNVIAISKDVSQKELDVLPQEPLVRVILGQLMNAVNLLVPQVIVLLAQQVKLLELLVKLKHALMLQQHSKQMLNALPIHFSVLQIMVVDVLNQAVVKL